MYRLNFLIFVKTWYTLSFQLLIDKAKVKGNILTVTQCYRKQRSHDHPPWEPDAFNL